MAVDIVFKESTGIADSVYGKSQDPIRMFIEKKAEAFEAESIAKKIFTHEKSNNYAERITSMTAMKDFEAVGENGLYPSNSMEESYSKTLTHMTWKSAFGITQEMVEDSKLMDLKKQPAAFITAYYRTREKFAAALLAGGMGSASTITFGNRPGFDVTSADNVQLFSKAHTAFNGSKNGVEAQSNLFANEFNVETLGALECAMQDFYGDTGEVLDVAPDTIIIPNDYALKKAVFEAVGADKDPNSSNNGFNYQFGRWNIIVWPYLSQYIKQYAPEGSKPWILFDSRYNSEYAGAMWFERAPLNVHSTIDDETDANVWRGRARFSAGFNDWRAFAVGGVQGGSNLTL